MHTVYVSQLLVLYLSGGVRQLNDWQGILSKGRAIASVEH